MTQLERIYKYMEEHGSITPIEATVNIGVIDLARSISYMRKHGYDDIIGTPESGKNRYGDPVHYYRYSIRKENDHA